jgi:hypothetical protein
VGHRSGVRARGVRGNAATPVGGSVWVGFARRRVGEGNVSL